MAEADDAHRSLLTLDEAAHAQQRAAERLDEAADDDVGWLVCLSAQCELLQRGRAGQRGYSVELLLAKRREEKVMGGYAVRLHRLDRRIQDDGRKQHSESYFGDWGHVQGHAGERPQIGHCD